MASPNEMTEQDDALEANEKLALLAQQREFEFEHARETEAKKWFPSEMDEETDSEAESSE